MQPHSRIFICTSVPSGHFPPPTTPEELGARILIQERYEKYGESEEVEMEVESEDDDDDREDRNNGQPSQPDQDTQVQDMDEVRTVHCYTLIQRDIIGLLESW